MRYIRQYDCVVTYPSSVISRVNLILLCGEKELPSSFFSSNKFRTLDKALTPVAITSGYFALCPTGYQPWSVRLYDAIMHDVVPVILANGIIEPFEKFLSWESFTVFKC